MKKLITAVTAVGLFASVSGGYGYTLTGDAVGGVGNNLHTTCAADSNSPGCEQERSEEE